MRSLESAMQDYFKDLWKRAEDMGLVKDGEAVETPFHKKCREINENVDKLLNGNPAKFPIPRIKK